MCGIPHLPTMTNAVCDQVEESVACNGITKIEVFNAKSALHLPQSDWIAGVDCNQDKFRNDIQPDKDCSPKTEQDKSPKCNEEMANEEMIGSHDNQEDKLEQTKVELEDNDKPNQPELFEEQEEQEVQEEVAEQEEQDQEQEEEEVQQEDPEQEDEEAVVPEI